MVDGAGAFEFGALLPAQSGGFFIMWLVGLLGAGLRKNLLDGFQGNLVGGRGMGQGGAHKSLVWIQIYKEEDPGIFITYTLQEVAFPHNFLMFSILDEEIRDHRVKKEK